MCVCVLSCACLCACSHLFADSLFFLRFSQYESSFCSSGTVHGRFLIGTPLLGAAGRFGVSPPSPWLEPPGEESELPAEEEGPAPGGEEAEAAGWCGAERACALEEAPL